MHLLKVSISFSNEETQKVQVSRGHTAKGRWGLTGQNIPTCSMSPVAPTLRDDLYQEWKKYTGSNWNTEGRVLDDGVSGGIVLQYPQIPTQKQFSQDSTPSLTD